MAAARSPTDLSVGELHRRVTHFVGRVEEDGESTYLQSCDYFLNHLDTLLCVPWEELKPSGRSFAAGYLCHLAVDECWKKEGGLLFQKLGIQSWTDFPVPGDVGLTVFDFLSKDEIRDSPALDALLAQITIPDVFTHVPGKMFVRQWEIIRNYVFARGNPEAHFQMLELAGWSKQDIANTRQKYHIFWEKSLTFMEQSVGVEPFLKEGIERSQQGCRACLTTILIMGRKRASIDSGCPIISKTRVAAANQKRWD